MKKSIPMILAAATAVTFAGQAAQAGIHLTATVVPWTVSVSNQSKLNLNGWEALRLTLVADANGTPSTGVVSWDFANPVAGFTTVANGPIGITGNLFQAWTVPLNGDPTQPTPQTSSTANNGGVPQGASTTLPLDSFWAHYPNSYGFTDGSSPGENNNLANLPAGHTNQVDGYNASPLADGAIVLDGDGNPIANGSDRGVGSSMVWAGAIKPDSNTANVTAINVAPVSVDLAFLIVPTNLLGQNNVRIYGVTGDSAGHIFVLDQIVNAPVVSTPEPASVGLIGLGAAGLLARRRNKR